MNDYNYGNYICNLREEKGYSQFQLGRLVGVSDKAVSKWENGNAKPRMKTCVRLAAVLGVPLADFLQGLQLSKPDNKEKLMNESNRLWAEAEELLKQRYGERVPAAFWGRYQSEKNAFSGKNVPVHFDFLRKLYELAAQQGMGLTIRGDVDSSYIAWLLGASKVNPAPVHTYCESCKKVRFYPDVKDGFDIPEGICECGGRVRGDGHNIPFEDYLQSATQAVHLNIEIDPAFLPAAVSLMETYYEKMYRCVPVDLGHGDGISHFVLAEQDSSLLGEYRDAPVKMDYELFWNRYGDLPNITFLHFTEQKSISRGECKSFLANITPDKLEALYRQMCEELRSMGAEDPLKKEKYNGLLEESEKCELTFSLLLQMDGLIHGTGIWEDNGEKLVRNGTLSLQVVPAFREDIWDLVMHGSNYPTESGTGIACRCMRAVSRGNYANGRSAISKELLQEIGMPEWFEPFAGKIKYMFPKGHCIEQILKRLNRLV